MSSYIILPFNFKYSGDTVLMVNQAGEWLTISRNDFDKFHSYKLEAEDECYKRLKAKHFLTITEEKEQVLGLLAIKLRTRKAFAECSPNLHMIVATLRCNCLCKYCHASSIDMSAKQYDMGWETARKTIDLIFQSPSDDIKIEYQGGEPLLNWDIVKESILYAKFVNKIARKNLSFVICTNLMQISKEQIDFFKKHSIEISTSLDGPKQLHDTNRKSRIFESSYDKFIENSKLVRDCAPLLTITKTNINKLRSVIDTYVELGYNTIFLRALNPYGNAIKNKSELDYSTEEFISAYKDALQYIIELNKKGIDFVECYTALFLTRILTPFSTGFVDLQSPSGAGLSGVIYNYDGKVYPADEARMLARMGDYYFCLGTVDEKFSGIFNGQVMHSIVRNSCVEAMPVCSECVYQQYCGADVIRNYLETKDLMGNRRKSGFCKKNKMVLDYIFYLLNKNDEQMMDIFWSWVTRRPYGEINLEKN